jgi:hypothetical protein
MKLAIGKSLAFAVVVLGLCAGSAQAQEMTVKVKVPFAFLVQGQMMPAGEYVVRPVNLDHTAMVIKGEDANRKAIAIVLTTPADGHDPAGEKPALSFSRVENQYRLSAIWESENEGQRLSKKG